MNHHARGHTILSSRTNRWLVRASALLLLGLMFLLNFGLQPVNAAPSPTGATIASDQADYPPGATVILTGAGWASNESVHIVVNDDAGQLWSLESNPDPIADSSGGFTYSFQLPNYFVATYAVTAEGATSGIATASFTDNDPYDWSQCKNDSGGGSPLSGGNNNDNTMDYCQWVNGNIGPTNSIYAEGDTVPQRAIRLVETAGSHFITLDHSFYNTSGDSYTYDFWAAPDATLKGLLAACNDIGGPFSNLGTTGCLTLLGAKTVVPLPDESMWTIGATNYVQPDLAAAVANASAVTRELWISCGYLSSGSIVSSPCTGVTLTILGHGASNGTLLSSANQTAALVDSYTQMKVSFTTAQANSFVVIWVGGHLAKTSFWNSLTDAYKAPGANSGSGSSFHERILADDGGSIGNRDNQLQAGVVVAPGSLTVVKDDLTNSSKVFPFTANSPLTPTSFNLCDPAITGCASSQAFNNLPSGSYTVSENDPSGTGLVFKTVNCTSGTSSWLPVSPRGVTITLQPGDNVTCTFTNGNPPTAAYLSTFKVRYVAPGTKVTWKTVNEMNVVGFNVLRSRARDGTYTKINTTPIYALHTGQLVGDKYAFRDTGVKAGRTYYYKIEVMGPLGTLETSDAKRVIIP